MTCLFKVSLFLFYFCVLPFQPSLSPIFFRLSPLFPFCKPSTLPPCCSQFSEILPNCSAQGDPYLYLYPYLYLPVDTGMGIDIDTDTDTDIGRYNLGFSLLPTFSGVMHFRLLILCFISNIHSWMSTHHVCLSHPGSYFSSSIHLHINCKMSFFF